MIQKSSSICPCIYDVFLNFRGEDTRKNFTDHLCTALVQTGIHTFRDNEKIERGKNIKDEIENAILYESKFFIIVFSKDYASSTWCLDELVKILEHRKSSQHTILPIFYDVDPAQVKNQTGSYAEAFSKHEESFKSERDMVQKWRVALKQVANLGGMVLQNRYESQFIQDIVKQVQNKLHRTTLYVPPYLVGIDSLVRHIIWWLKEDELDKVGIATICRIGGIGKTTIAKVVYNQNIQKFEGYSFLANVRETCDECNGLIHLQRQLISDIAKGKVQKIYNADEGINMIKKIVCCRRVLLVLDDVDDLEKVNKIIGTQIPLHPRSKIIITSRNRNLLTAPSISQLFDLESLCSYADPCKVFEKYSEILWWASISSSSFGFFTIWQKCKCMEKCIEKLEAIPDSKMQKILRASYDSLQDDHDKNLFLDIACFFIGKDKDYAITILDGCDFYTTIGIENLIGRSLLIVNEENKLMMHQLVRDMGLEIIRQESPNLGKRSRLWHRDALDVLREKIGSKTIKGLSVDLQESIKHKTMRTTTGLHFAKHSKFRFVISNEANIETKAFAMMRGLKLLQLDYVKLNGDFKDFPKGLIWLCWHGFPLKSLPANFDIKRLIVLEMRHSSLNCILYDTEV
ncbi:hypothetical protein DITRI_Ditri15bG0066000 [Diplodiscus trichospermus]